MRLAIIASLLLASTSAFAAPAAPARTDSDADSAARRTAPAAAAKSDVRAVYDFENDSVSGDALKPDHEVARTRVVTQRESMIQLRLHFIPQMVQMANDV